MKKLLAVILVLTMLLSLAACGGNGGKDVKQVEAPTLTYLYNTGDSWYHNESSEPRMEHIP